MNYFLIITIILIIIGLAAIHDELEGINRKLDK